MNHELPDVPAGFRKGRGTRDQNANICWIIAEASKFQKNIYFYFITNAKAFDCVDHNKLWKTLKEVGIPNHLTCLLRLLYAGQGETVRTGHGTERLNWTELNEDNGDLLQRSCAYTVVFSATYLAIGHCHPIPPPETPGHSQDRLTDKWMCFNIMTNVYFWQCLEMIERNTKKWKQTNIIITSRKRRYNEENIIQ